MVLEVQRNSYDETGYCIFHNNSSVTQKMCFINATTLLEFVTVRQKGTEEMEACSQMAHVS